MDNVNAFLRYLKAEKNYSAHTITAYRKDISDFAQHCLSTYQIQDLTNVHYAMVRDFVVVLSQKGLSLRSINRKCVALNSFFNYLLSINQIAAHPLERHKSLKAKKAFIIPFSVYEVEKVLAKVDNKRSFFKSLKVLLIEPALAYTGMSLSNFFLPEKK